MVIHTRSEQYIHSIPSLQPERSVSSDNGSALETVVRLVHSDPHVVAIEHLSRLKSECDVRASLQSWVQNDSRHLFLLLVDMNQDGCLDRGMVLKTFFVAHNAALFHILTDLSFLLMSF